MEQLPLVLTAAGGLITAIATAIASLRQSRAAERSAIRAEAHAAAAERRLEDLLRPTLYVPPSSDAQRARFARATVVLTSGRAELTAALEVAPGRDRFVAVSAAHERLAQCLIALVPAVAFPQGAAMIDAAAQVRLCATRAAGAPSAVGSAEEWQAELATSLRRLELAVVTAITATPDHAEDWLAAYRRHMA